MHRERLTIFGIPIDRMTLVEVRSWIRRAYASARAHRAITLNPEIALAGYENPRYATLLRTADLVTVDGVGVLFALRLRRQIAPERITGLQLLAECCAIAADEGRGAVFLLRVDGRTPPPLLRAVCTERWPDLRASVVAVDPRAAIDPAIAQAIRDAAPALLVTNFGHPAQEEWIAARVDMFPSVRLALGVGGAIDYLSGTAPLPPAMLRRFGLEWCWRLLRQPRRYRRIARAVFAFPLACILDALQSYARCIWPRAFAK